MNSQKQIPVKTQDKPAALKVQIPEQLVKNLNEEKQKAAISNTTIKK